MTRAARIGHIVFIHAAAEIKHFADRAFADELLCILQDRLRR